MKRRKMSALQRKYFGKHHKAVSVRRSHSKRKVVYVARRRSYRSRGRSYARKGIGGLKGLIVPIGAGVAEQYVNNFIPISGVAPAAAGMFLHNETLKTIGLYQIGLSLGNIIPLPGIGGSVGGNFT
jgi:hypothetical protein